ncbi:MAG: substrate-binding domain-containing protein [Candidatus Marinimicrobia bacterium]|nr:substrate-binding domain-containing protein [Candidatus Neomarinimicrobiota bacterium]
MLNKQYLPILCILAISVIFNSCSLFTENEDDEIIYEDPVDVSHFSIANYPKVDGSTSCHPLQIVIACEILDVEYQWYEGFDGMLRIWPSDDDSTKDGDIEYIYNIQHAGTHGSYVNLIEDSVDLIIAARLPSEDELILADSLNINISTKAIALDAFVFILNTQNSVNNLSVEQIRGIYSGAITNWNSVSGDNAAINPYQRNKNSGSQELMESLVMIGLPMVEAPDLLVLGSMMGPINRLNEDPYGLGYTVYFFNNYMAQRNQIKLCSVNGVFPDPQSISSGSYIYTTMVYAAIRSTLNVDGTAFTLWKWLQTEIGQQTVGESGYIPYLE